MSVFLPPLQEAGFSSFNPAEHARDPLGRFRKMLTGLHGGGGVNLPTGVSVERKRQGNTDLGFKLGKATFIVRAGGGTSLETQDPQAAAAKALDLVKRREASKKAPKLGEPGSVTNPKKTVAPREGKARPTPSGGTKRTVSGAGQTATRTTPGPGPPPATVAAGKKGADLWEKHRAVAVGSSRGVTTRLPDEATAKTLAAWLNANRKGEYEPFKASGSGNWFVGIKRKLKEAEPYLPPLAELTSGGVFAEGKHKRGKKGTPEGGRFVKSGSSGKEVRGVQAKLGGIKVDGAFGPKTQKAVRSFQKQNGLQVDGVVGRQTAAALLGREKKRSVGALTDQQKLRLSAWGKRGR